jgi:hypothetical protein
MRGRARNRGRGSLKPMARLEPIARNPSVAKAVDVLDRLSLGVARQLRMYPLARLVFLCYFILLHLWAFFVLVFHTHRIEEIHSDVGGSFQNPGPSALPY